VGGTDTGNTRNATQPRTPAGVRGCVVVGPPQRVTQVRPAA
jgi:hypothetical protein